MGKIIETVVSDPRHLHRRLYRAKRLTPCFVISS